MANNIKSDPVAVIVVHGVGDRQPFEISRETADLLANLKYEPQGDPRYAPFTETVQRINVRPVKVVKDRHEWLKKEHQRFTWGPLDAVARQANQSKYRIERAESSVDSLDHIYMEGQLADYKGESPEETFQSMRIEGERVPPTTPSTPQPDASGEMLGELRQHGVTTPQQRARGEQNPRTETAVPPPITARPVHIYEMYWADLSRLGNAFTQAFAELYQILFHLATVGVNNVTAAGIQFKGKPGANRWRWFGRAETAAAAALAWPIPILNLLLAMWIPPVLAISLMRTYLQANQEVWSVLILGGMIAAMTCAYLIFRRGQRGAAMFFPLPLIAIFVCWAGWQFQNGSRELAEAGEAFLVTGVSCGAVALVLRAYNRRRPGSWAAGLLTAAVYVLAILVALVFGRMTGLSAPRYTALIFCLNAMEVAFVLLGVAWTGFYFCYAWAHIAGMLAVSSVKDVSTGDLARSKRTRWTARLVLGMSSCVFVVSTISIWGLVAALGVELLPGSEFVPPLNKPAEAELGSAAKPCPQIPRSTAENCGIDDDQHRAPVVYEPVFDKLVAAWVARPPKIYYAAHWVEDSMRTAGLATLPPLLGLLAAAFLMLAWAVGPCVWAEISPPKGNRPHDVLTRAARSFGTWLDDGFRFAKVAGALIYTVMFLIFPLSVLYYLLPDSGTWLSRASFTWGVSLSKFTVPLTAGGAAALLGLGGRLNKFARGIRPIIRVMLDVDNWMREHPRDANPTARICGRYVSLLRHLSQWREGDNKYRAIVIVAHSQGAVITSDLLRFLTAERNSAGSMKQYDAELALTDEVPIYVFSMGSPLRQLYARRFPYLYGYGRDENALALTDFKARDIASDASPDPKSMGARMWVNAFRTGDYIGRQIWRADGTGYGWDPIAPAPHDTWDPPAGKPDLVSSDVEGTRVEFSIGPGAHTHYFDATAGLVAEVLDRLIATA